MFNDYSFNVEWKQCASMAALAQKYKPMTIEEEKVLLTEYYSYKRLWYTTTMVKGKERQVVNLEDLPNLTIHDRRRQKEIKDEMVLKNLRIIIKYTKSPQFLDKGIPLVELINEGILGFIYCLDRKFDLSKGNRFNTVSIWWVKQAVGRAIENKSTVVRLPLHIRDKINKIRNVYRDYIKDNEGVSPDSTEISILIEQRYGDVLDTDEIEEIGRLQYLAASLDESSSEDGEAGLVDYISINGEDEIVEEVERSANKDYVSELLKQLTHEEAKLITFKFGLIDLNTKRSNQELSHIMGMTKTEYLAFEKKVMEKLRLISDRERANL